MKINNPFLTTKQNKGLFILEQKVITHPQVRIVCYKVKSLAPLRFAGSNPGSPILIIKEIK